MFDDILLQDYMDKFYGYGNFSSDYWFVGMEEGGGQSFEEVQRRLTIWHNRGRKPLEDLRDYHYAIGITQFFDEPVRLQSTWNKLIRVLLSAQGQRSETENVRLYQRAQFGRQQGDHCLLELLPLPNPSLNPADWQYHRYSRLSSLATRAEYQAHFLSLRTTRLHEQVWRFHPKVVVFYGLSYEHWWRQIATTNFSADKVKIASDGKTLFVIMPHPVAYGLKNDDFHEIGQTIRRLIASPP